MSLPHDYLQSDARNLETVLDWVRWGASQFSDANLYFGHGTENAWDEAWFLVSWSIHQSWEVLDKIQFARLTNSEKQKIYALYKRRIDERTPAPYLTGVAWFAGYPYKVTPDVLVPRSPIAELILRGFEPWLSSAPEKILDVCTGSGCIGIACAHQFESAKVDVSDISEAALAVARQNITFHQVEDRVSALMSDGFNDLAGRRYSLIISNPPYVDEEDLVSMPAEFHVEPVLGLASGRDGLDFIRRILSEAASHLDEKGLLVVEVGNSWRALESAFPKIPFLWADLERGGHGVFILTKEQLRAGV